MLAHVLAVQSTRYREALASTSDEVLAGCVCARCSGTDLHLTNSWVSRGVNTSAGFGYLMVRLARCRTCNARERVLPCDVLPGKTNDVGGCVKRDPYTVTGQSLGQVAGRRA